VRIAGIVLAAGASERMDGGPKQLLPFGDTTMTGRIVDTAEQSSLDPVVVVTGHSAVEVERALTLRRARFARNPNFRRGNMSSLHTATSILDDGDAVMLLLGDQPEVTLETIEVVAAAFRELRPFAAMTRYRGTIGHPWILSSEAVAQSGELRGTKALWQWLTVNHGDDLVIVERDLERPIDVNTTADYEAALARLGLWPGASPEPGP
jgi:molybdenum cofactor cytidylyltransferase